jgi:hypothetical protein
MTTHETQNQLESILDGYSLFEVLESLRDICMEKSDHLEANWQDSATAKEWERAYHLLDRTMVKAQKLGIPQPRNA